MIGCTFADNLRTSLVVLPVCAVLAGFLIRWIPFSSESPCLFRSYSPVAKGSSYSVAVYTPSAAILPDGLCGFPGAFRSGRGTFKSFGGSATPGIGSDFSSVHLAFSDVLAVPSGVNVNVF